MYNPFVDMDRVGPALAVAFLAVAVWIRVRRFVSWVHSYCPCLVPRCCHPLLGVKNEDRKRRGGRKPRGGGIWTCEEDGETTRRGEDS